MSETKKVEVLTDEERREAMKLIALPNDAKEGAPQRRALRKLVARYEATLADSQEHAMMSWECLTMARETVAAILGENWEHIAPMFLPEAIRSACYRAATGKLAAEVMPPDACSRQLADLKATLAKLATVTPLANSERETLPASFPSTPEEPTDG